MESLAGSAAGRICLDARWVIDQKTERPTSRVVSKSIRISVTDNRPGERHRRVGAGWLQNTA